MIFLDSETVGLTGPPVLIQWAEDDGPVHLHDVWANPRETIRLIEWICEREVCAYNLSFDWFHIVRLYDVLTGESTWDNVVQGGLNAKPAGALDLYLHMLKGSLQELRERKNVRVRRVPTAAAHALCDQLTQEATQWPAILAPWWRVIEQEDGWSDVVLSFRPSKGLKSVCSHILDVEVIDFPAPDEIMPKDERTWNFTDTSKWEPYLEPQIEYWRTNGRARAYAEQDITLLRDLWEAEGRPVGDYDSDLAVATACARYWGFDIDRERMSEMRGELAATVSATPLDHHAVRRTLREKVPEIIEVNATNDKALETYEPFCPEYVAQVRAGRAAKKSLDVVDKILAMGRFHPEFNVVGTLTGRMTAPIAMLIPKGPLRECFTLGEFASGGDFAGFEVAIAAALFADEKLTDQLEQGQKFHALYGAGVYGMDYDEILKDKERYNKAKSAVFATFYGAQPPKVAETLGLPLEAAEKGRERLLEEYPGIRREQEFVAENYSTMNQRDGGAVIWKDPKESVESLFGYTRSFKVETLVARTLYRVAEDLTGIPEGHCTRREHKGRQTFNGACRSALYGAAFQIQAGVARVAGNHRIQATGGELTKWLQSRIWGLQPAGVAKCRVLTYQVHDEVLVTCDTVERTHEVEEIVRAFVAENKKHVPMLEIEWTRELRDWSEK